MTLDLIRNSKMNTALAITGGLVVTATLARVLNTRARIVALGQAIGLAVPGLVAATLAPVGAKREAAVAATVITVLSARPSILPALAKTVFAAAAVVAVRKIENVIETTDFFQRSAREVVIPPSASRLPNLVTAAVTTAVVAASAVAVRCAPSLPRVAVAATLMSASVVGYVAEKFFTRQ